MQFIASHGSFVVGQDASQFDKKNSQMAWIHKTIRFFWDFFRFKSNSIE